jgi:hypothetical protein
MNARPDPAAVAGLCFLACALIVAYTFAAGLWTRYAPTLRELILATVTPQFAVGLFAGIALTALSACLFAWSER